MGKREGANSEVQHLRGEIERIEVTHLRALGDSNVHNQKLEAELSRVVGDLQTTQKEREDLRKENSLLRSK